MMPGLGQKYDIEIETVSKPKEDDLTDEYFELDLPVTPAVMLDDEIGWKEPMCPSTSLSRQNAGN